MTDRELLDNGRGSLEWLRLEGEHRFLALCIYERKSPGVNGGLYVKGRQIGPVTIECLVIEFNELF